MSKLSQSWEKRPVRIATWSLLGIAAVAAAFPFAWAKLRGSEARQGHPAEQAAAAREQGEANPVQAEAGVVLLTADQQKSIGLEVAPAEPSPGSEIIEAPGKVTPDETRFAYITPRAAGVVRNVSAQIGQDVRAGQLLATIDSPEVAQARLELLTKEQMLDVARTRADWQEGITAATLELIDQLKNNVPPEEIRRRFEGRAIGADRERLLTADANRRLTWTSLERNKDLLKNNAVALSRYQMVVAEYESALATYQGLMDRVGVETQLANTLAQQELRAAQTSTRVAKERLRVLDVPLEPDEAPLPEGPKSPPASDTSTQPLSTYTIRAPFDGVILDREMIVPGVPVDLARRIFTMADLRSVWVEASVHESHFALLGASDGAEVLLSSPAYPGRTFAGKVIYTGDLVDEKSRMVKLLARAENPGRELKPGMYVDVAIHTQGGRKALVVPFSSLVTEADRTFVYVRDGDERFRRRDVVVGDRIKDKALILGGLEPGAQVVSQGAFKLKAEEIRRSGG
ncbi:efflux RND transporter periplasmic adaptor subunit [Tundrisphaera sp. TA3]|uniref:efflux RND transporter periplasmic adaptor subunit n=1 Tax=Tundrisphaera sp. TA3 TaxID=3435775 RepID=UPI003EC0073C